MTQTKKPLFVMMIGLPGMGKSSFAKKMFPNLKRLSTDDYIEKVAQEKSITYNEAFHSNIDDATRNMNLQLQELIANRESMIIDQTNVYAKSRRRKMANLPKEYFKLAVVMKPCYDRIKQVNEERMKYGRAIPDSVIEQMIQEHVTDEENFDYVIIL